MELHAPTNPRCSLTFVGKQRPEQQLKLRSRSTRPHCPGISQLRIVSERARSVPGHSDPQLAQRLQESASTSAESTNPSQVCLLLAAVLAIDPTFYLNVTACLKHTRHLSAGIERAADTLQYSARSSTSSRTTTAHQISHPWLGLSSFQCLPVGSI